MTMLKPIVRSEVAPWAGFRELEDRLNRAFNGWPMDQDTSTCAGFVPAVDIVESENHYTLSADLPGLRREDIKLSITEDVITLKGARVLVDRSARQILGDHATNTPISSACCANVAARVAFLSVQAPTRLWMA